jgi:hypothetical protein
MGCNARKTNKQQTVGLIKVLKIIVASDMGVTV